MNNFSTYQSRQRGVVLFIALIALVVMSLAGVALIRSVDTNTVITGNLSFKQSALVSSDSGVESAINWANGVAAANLATLDADNTARGYLASIAVDLDDRSVLKDSNTWDDNAFEVATADPDNKDDAGNVVNYIIQRMCNAAGPPTKESCLYASSETENSGFGGRSGSDCCEIIQAGESPVYRVTVRVEGPKNTVSYAQTYVY